VVTLLLEWLDEISQRRPRCPCKRGRTAAGLPICRRCWSELGDYFQLRWTDAVRRPQLSQIDWLTRTLRASARKHRRTNR
jgi:hypothetical protein